ncbi:carbon-nitrogen hydrolase family protein [Rheinheimera texasensis]|uniref:carbon-nitrogen hydrolase family protein n=1 Tax=Rheinheimera texasensis TaxID=306205 RepID=UPI0004E238DF|nr:carbon-nitrogen hydrolase family protein [Rheinheimera texasensis]
MTETTSIWQLTALQLCSSPDPAENLRQIADLLQQLPPARPQLVALPEGALCFAGADGANLAIAEPLSGPGVPLSADQPIQQQLSALARLHYIYLLVGTLPTLSARAQTLPSQSDEPARFSASSLLFGPDGTLLSDYQKIHLFDADVSDNTASYRESATTKPGDKVTVADLGAVKAGLAICYDVRFPGLFAQLRQHGMNLLCLPSAFTTVTGAAHWHTLLRARAIETQSFVLAPAQTGTHANGRQTYGHSLIIDPWGQVLADAGTEPGLISVRIDLQEVAKVRHKMPLALHNQFICTQMTSEKL